MVVLLQAMIGQHASLYELLHLLSHGDFKQSYQAAGILRRYSSSSQQSEIHLQRLLAVSNCCKDLLSGG